MNVDTERLRAACERSLKLDRRVHLAGLADRGERIAMCEQTLALLAERDALEALLHRAFDVLCEPTESGYCDEKNAALRIEILRALAAREPT
ncbi:MAG: hypothetical protein KA200_01900 [Burkholderiales bacterium]|nr:hypothetical protein [Burkholderiales bacterium]